MSAGEVVPAARALAAHGLVDAFGHVSARTATGFAMTPPVPLGTLGDDAPLVEVALDAEDLPPGAPKEAWLHLAVYARRPDVGGICRAMPPSAAAAVVAGVPLLALHGQGAFLGAEVPVHDDARLARAAAGGEAVAATLGAGEAVVLRGNGALTAAPSPGIAMALMHVLETTARLNLAAATTGSPRRLTAEELTSWRGVAPELLARLWAHLR